MKPSVVVTGFHPGSINSVIPVIEALRQEGKVDVNGAIKALELLGKHLGMFIDKHEHIIKIEEVKSYIHTVMLIMEKHIDNPDIRNRIAKDIAGIGLN